MRAVRCLVAITLLTAASAAFPSPAAVAGTAMDAQALPLLERPALTNPITLQITPAAPEVKNLDPNQDYIVTVAPGIYTKNAKIWGGHNVVLENAVLVYASPTAAQPTKDVGVRGLYLTGQTGVMYVNGLQIRGTLNEGIQLSETEPGATVVLRNIAIDPVTGSEDTWHADLLQTWAGPAKLVVDGFTGTSNFQGMFLTPNQKWNGPKPEFFWLRNVHLNVALGRYALWTDGFGAFPLQTTDVTVKPRSENRDQWLWPKPSTGDTTWQNVTADPLIP